jgi:hypothetical protein
MPKTLGKRHVEAHQGHFATHTLWRRSKKPSTLQKQAHPSDAAKRNWPFMLSLGQLIITVLFAGALAFAVVFKEPAQSGKGRSKVVIEGRESDEIQIGTKPGP